MNSQNEAVINNTQDLPASLDTPKHTFCKIQITKTDGNKQFLRTKFMRMNNVDKLPSMIRKQLDTNLYNTLSKELRELDLFSLKNIEFIDEVEKQSDVLNVPPAPIS